MRGWLGLVALAGALLFTSHADASQVCHGPTTVTTNGTEPSAAPWEPNNGLTDPSAWFTVTTKGSGTPQAIINVYAPTPSGTRTARAVHQLAVLSAQYSYAYRPGSAGAMEAVISGCTNCSVDVTFCGEEAK